MKRFGNKLEALITIGEKRDLIEQPAPSRCHYVTDTDETDGMASVAQHCRPTRNEQYLPLDRHRLEEDR